MKRRYWIAGICGASLAVVVVALIGKVAMSSDAAISVSNSRTHSGCQPRKVDGAKNSLEGFPGSLTGDMWRYYTEVESAVFEFQKPNQWQETSCRLLPAAEVKLLWDCHGLLHEMQLLLEQNLITKAVFDERRAFLTNYESLVRIA